MPTSLTSPAEAAVPPAPPAPAQPAVPALRAWRRPRAMAGAAALVALLAWALASPLGLLNALASIDSHRSATGLPYGALPRQRLDVYTPRTPVPPGGYPVLVFFYGGSWRHGQRADYRFVGEALAARGVLTLVADYRLYPEVRYPLFLADSAAALAYALREAPRLGGDPRRVHVMGHSAGAYNAAMLALDPRWLAAAGAGSQPLAGWIGLAGPYDFLPMRNPDTQPVFFHPHYPADSQPLALASALAPRSFLGAAPDDALVDPRRNTGALARHLRSLGVAVDERSYPRLNHLSLVGALAGPLQWLAPVLDDVVAFIQAAPAPAR